MRRESCLPQSRTLRPFLSWTITLKKSYKQLECSLIADKNVEEKKGLENLHQGRKLPRRN